ncbi:MAG: hypothetical protein ACE14T_10210 [Syntrophales bacterium]
MKRMSVALSIVVYFIIAPCPVRAWDSQSIYNCTDEQGTMWVCTYSVNKSCMHHPGRMQSCVVTESSCDLKIEGTPGSSQSLGDFREAQVCRANCATRVAATGEKNKCADFYNWKLY